MEKLNSKHERARKRVKEIKGFYDHVKIFIVVNAFFYLLKSGWLNTFMPEGVELIPVYFNWVNVNLLVWLSILAVHAVYITRHRWAFLKKWEERKIKEFMDKERDEINKSL